MTAALKARFDMDKRLEKIIAKDLGISIEEIRETSWETLVGMRKKLGESAFRPKDMFIVGGNINLTLKREMGMLDITIREMIRKVKYKFKCLLRNKRHA